MTLPLSKEQIEAIRARAEKATRKTRTVRHTPFPAGWLREEMEVASAEVALDREITPSILSSLSQQALPAIELEVEWNKCQDGLGAAFDENKRLQSERDRMREALEKIACWGVPFPEESQGYGVHALMTAREACPGPAALKSSKPGEG